MANPYYQQSGVTIYHGDCRGIIDDLDGFDLVVTDPPYGISYRSRRRMSPHGAIEGDKELDVETISKLIDKPSVASYVFCQWDMIPKMPKPRSLLVWVKNNRTIGDVHHRHARQWEGICFYPGPEHSFVKRPSDVLHFDRTQNNLHPTQKPVDLMKRILSFSPAESVLDPYCGSGSTLLAAKALGMRAVGIEINERYCEIAANQLEQEYFKWQ